MIIVKKCKSIFNGNDLSLIKHNGVAYTDDEVYIIDDESDLAKKVWDFCPDFDYVVTNGKLVDIVAMEHVATTEELRGKYEALVVSKIRSRYTQDDEYKVLREYLADNNTLEFTAYNNYVKTCKAEAHLEIYGKGAVKA